MSIVPVADVTIKVTNKYLETHLGTGHGTIKFAIRSSMRLKKVFKVYGKRYGVKDSTILHFTFNGKRLSETDTAESINIEDGGQIECFTPLEELFRELIDVCKSDNLSFDLLKDKVKLIGPDTINTIWEKCEECAYLYTFFHLACLNKNITWEIIDYLIDMFPEAADSQVMERTYPLHLACFNQYCPGSVIERLVQSNPEICNVKGGPIAEELPLHHYLSRNINYDRNVIVLPLEYNKALLMRVKDLVSEGQIDDNNIISDEEMRIIAANVPTTAKELADCGLSENIIQNFGELIIKNVTSFIKEEELECYIESLTNKDDDDVSMDQYDSTDDGDSSVDSADVSLQHTWEQIKINDPATTSIYIPFGDDDDVFGSIDWKNEAQYFSSNTHLKRIMLSGMDADTIAHPHELLTALDQNRSIEDMAFHYCKGSSVTKVLILYSWKGEFNNLKRLEFVGCCPNFVIGTLTLCNKLSLEDVKIDGYDSFTFFQDPHINLTHEYQLSFQLNRHQNIKHLSLGLVNSSMEKVLVTLKCPPSLQNLKITALNQHHNLVDIALELTLPNSQELDSDNVAKYNLSMLPRQSRQILNLNLSDGEMNDDDITSLANQLASTNGLYQLSLAGRPSVSQNGWNECFSGLENNNIISTLRELDLHNNRGITDDVMTTLVGLVGSVSSLERIILRRCRSITSRGWQAFSALSLSKNCNLKHLELCDNNIDDEVMPTLVGSLGRISSLKILELKSCPSVTSQGWQTFSNLLQNNICKLNMLNISSNQIDDDVLTAFAAALVNNRSMHTLFINDTHITNRGWAALTNTLCDPLSIEATYASNHMLNDVITHSGDDNDLPKDLKTMLRINGRYDIMFRYIFKERAAREKILRCHMSTFNGINDVFVDMDLGVMPFAIAWMGWDDKGHSALYQLFRSLPGLFERNNTVAANQQLKRKRNELG